MRLKSEELPPKVIGFLRFSTLLVWTSVVLLVGMNTDQHANAQQVNFRNYSVGDGLAQSQVFAIAEDRNGYLWFGTKGGGLSRFDGIHFTAYTIRDGIINDFINTILPLRNGNFCIGTNTGISIYDGKQFSNYNVGKDSIGLPVYFLLEDSKERIWMGTSKGLYYYKNESVHCYTCAHDLPREIISCMYIDHKGKFWYGDDFGLHRIDTVQGKVRLKNFHRKEGLSNVLVRTLREPVPGTLIAGTYGGGLFQISNEKISALSINKQLESKIIHDLIIDNNGNWWMSTYDAGVYRMYAKDSTLSHFTINEGLANDHASVLYQDSWGNIWVGTSGGGVSRFSGERFKHYTERNGLNGNYVYSIQTQGDSLLWMGTSAKGITCMNLTDGSITRFGAEEGMAEEKVKTIEIDSNGVLWIGTEGMGLWRKDSSGFSSITTRQGLSGNWIKDILRAKDGKLWIATAGGGISVITDEEPLHIRKLTEKDGIAKNRINALHEDQLGRLWYATEGGGIGMIGQDGIRNFTTVQGLSGNLARCLREDRNGFLWVATGGGGLSRLDLYRGFGIDRITSDNGLSSDNLYLLEIDAQNNLWAGSENGVDRILLSENSEVREIKHYGQAEGFIGIETCQNAVALAPDGSLWFGTINGLTRHDPKNSDRNLLPPRLRFTGVNLFYQPLQNTRFSDHVEAWENYSDQLELRYDENHIGFEFIGVDHRNPSSVKYQWKLEGADTSWSPLSLKREVTYSNLSPGEYVFMVRAINEDGIASEEALQFRFTITPPWWQQWWFRLLAIASGFLVIAGIILLITRRSRRRVKNMREKLKVEKQLIELEQKALRLQMNPHFIFHALNSIQGLIVKKDEKTARLYLSKFSKLMRAILENSREQVIPLETEMETLRNYLELEQFTRENSFDFSIECDPEMDASDISIPSMLLQPFVENSIIHGFNGLDRRGNIQIIFHIKDHFLECIVRDNGVGRNKAQQNRMQQDAHHKSMALIVTQERLNLIQRQSGEHVLSNAISIHDLEEGTEVVIRLRV